MKRPLGEAQLTYAASDVTYLLELHDRLAARAEQRGRSQWVADACEELRRAAVLVTTLPGGRGAVRELIERMLKARGGWDAIVAHYAAPQT